MPNVTAPTRNDQNGQSYTYFLDSVSTTSTTYTYPAQQDALTVTNKGAFPITLTVNGAAYTIQGGGVQSVPTLFTSFSIVATGQTAFDAMAISETMNNTQLAGSNVKLLDAVSATGVGSPKPTGSFKSYDFEVAGTATSFTLHLEAVGSLGTVKTLLKVFDTVNNIYLNGGNSGDITASGFYSVAVPAFVNIQANLTAVAGGNVSISGGLMQ